MENSSCNHNMNNKESTEQYDAIIIGSGMGGLTVASLLAQLGKKRVLVLERHFKLGGFTHSFRRGRFEWDVGVHYVGEMYPKALSRRVMDLVTGKAVAWQPGGPVIERYHFPEGRLMYPATLNSFRSRCAKSFPKRRQKSIATSRILRAASFGSHVGACLSICPSGSGISSFGQGKSWQQRSPLTT